MHKNIGIIDRVARLIAGLALIAIALIQPGALWGWIGIVPLATALVGWCPAYRLLGLRTCPVDKAV